MDTREKIAAELATIESEWLLQLILRFIRGLKKEN